MLILLTEVQINCHISLDIQTLFFQFFLFLYMLKLLWQPQESCTSHREAPSGKTNQNEESIPGQNLKSASSIPWIIKIHTSPVHLLIFT